MGRAPTWVKHTLEDRSGVGSASHKLIDATAKLLARAGYNLWRTRNAASLEWEERVGITHRKGEMNKHGWRAWRQGSQGEKKRGRPRVEDRTD